MMMLCILVNHETTLDSVNSKPCYAEIMLMDTPTPDARLS